MAPDRTKFGDCFVEFISGADSAFLFYQTIIQPLMTGVKPLVTSAARLATNAKVWKLSGARGDALPNSLIAFQMGAEGQVVIHLVLARENNPLAGYLVGLTTLAIAVEDISVDDLPHLLFGQILFIFYDCLYAPYKFVGLPVILNILLNERSLRIMLVPKSRENRGLKESRRFSVRCPAVWSAFENSKLIKNWEDVSGPLLDALNKFIHKPG